jgi:tRNA1(Val) A37 N6-methylase TrmN6
LPARLGLGRAGGGARPPAVLEVGAGCGLLGLALAADGARRPSQLQSW